MAEKPQNSEVAKREEEILKFWQERNIFKKSLAKPAPKGEFVFYEGPPTANGRPGIHHLESRAFKDAIPRYRAMQGFRVRRKGGWDTHGLPVELEVEKELGIKNKKEIEAYGIAAFNAKCKESVLRYIGEWKEFSDRIAYWYDGEYFTFENSYIESVWHILKIAREKNLLYKDYKVVPWCPRCGTALSSHEVAQGYAETKDPAVYVKFKIKNPEQISLRGNAYLLAWTTTPWTLPGNVALAVGENVIYQSCRITGQDGSMIVAKDRAEAVFGAASSDFRDWTGRELVGLEYEPPYPFLKNSAPANQHDAFENAYKIYAADFVSTEDGTGVVHTAVMYGADDFELGTKLGLPKHHLVNEDGAFSHNAGLFAGMFVKAADEAIIEDLERRGLLFRAETIEHTYPFCWRCKTPLLYYARDSWYVAMSKLKNDLIRENEGIHWEPAHIRDGRFGEWLRDLKDWAISRSRYWGTPLPIWECERCKEFTVVGSRAELRERAAQRVPENLDFHRPFIDLYTMQCECGGEMKRVPEVLDVWFDSGAMPFAQDHYPFATKNILYPADFISEAIDQTRGWFYTLHAVGGIMGRGKAFKNVICLGHVLDAKGKKMSKSLGNIVVPRTAIGTYGADALRYFMYTVNAPGDSKNFDERLVDEIAKKNIGRLGNVLAFYELYQDGTEPGDRSANALDRWILARLNETIAEATRGFEAYQLDVAARPLSGFIDDLSAWYLRRSRERFKKEGADKQAAIATLRHVLRRLSLVMAPLMPFFAEYLFQAVRRDGDEESVHLSAWPKTRAPGFLERLFGETDEKILASMAEARRVVSQALDVRDKAGIKARQPLAALSIPADSDLPDEYLPIVAEEVNVKKIEKRGTVVALDMAITPELREEGAVRDAIRTVQAARKNAKLNPKDHVKLAIDFGALDPALVERNIEHIQKETNTSIEFPAK